VATVCLMGLYKCRSLAAGNNYAVFERVDGSLDCALVKADNIRPVLLLQHCSNTVWGALSSKHKSALPGLLRSRHADRSNAVSMMEGKRDGAQSDQADATTANNPEKANNPNNRRKPNVPPKVLCSKGCGKEYLVSRRSLAHRLTHEEHCLGPLPAPKKAATAPKAAAKSADSFSDNKRKAPTPGPKAPAGGPRGVAGKSGSQAASKKYYKLLSEWLKPYFCKSKSGMLTPEHYTEVLEIARRHNTAQRYQGALTEGRECSGRMRGKMHVKCDQTANDSKTLVIEIDHHAPRTTVMSIVETIVTSGGWQIPPSLSCADQHAAASALPPRACDFTPHWVRRKRYKISTMFRAFPLSPERKNNGFVLSAGHRARLSNPVHQICLNNIHYFATL
jgi:hypothetical protein